MNNWDNLATYFKYPQEIRTVIYTTNAVEAVHRLRHGGLEKLLNLDLFSLLACPPLAE
ncbi:Mobile element protein [hydrothermal vent metagenome]|uniref:Mobile element protein n=1 Tax=hydrothermal vent metagenome TaxID=652676 RepID=A0A3B1C8D9_9ZZZZ